MLSHTGSSVLLWLHMPPSITLFLPERCLSGCKVHIISIAKQYQEHQSHLSGRAVRGGHTVMCHGITPQWTDLTYIVANGNLWIWLINWWHRDEIMYEMMLHVSPLAEACTWLQLVVGAQVFAALSCSAPEGTLD